MSAHTPGPWTVATHTAPSLDEVTPGCDWTIYGSDGVSVCFEGAWNVHAAANVRLIIAAPDLLEALKNIVEFVNVRIDDSRIALFDAARAAITKAEGAKP